MANKFPVQFILGLKDQATENLKGVQKAFAGLERQASGFNRRMQMVGRDLEKTGKKMTVAVTAPIAALGAFAVKDAAKFEGEMAKVANLLNNQFVGTDLTNRLEEARTGFKKLALEFGVNKDELVKPFADLVDMGMSVDDAMKTLRAGLKLSTAEGSDLGETMSAISQIMKTTGLGADKVDELTAKIHMLNQAADPTGKTDLTSGLKDLIPISQDLGMSLDDTFALIATATKSKLVPADQAIQTLADTLKAFTKVKGDASKEAIRLGVDFGRTGIKAKGFDGILKQFVGNNKLVATSFDRLFKNKDAARLFKGLVEQLPELNKQMVELADNSKNVADLNADLDNVMGALDKQLDVLNVAFKEMRDEAFRGLVDFLKENGPTIVQTFKDIAETLRNNEGLRKFVFWAGAIAAVLGPVLIALGFMAQGLGIVWKAAVFLTTGIGKLGAILWAVIKPIMAFVAGISGTTLAAIGLFTVGIAGIAYAAKQIYDNWDSLVDFFDVQLTSAIEKPLDVLKRFADFLLKFPLEILNQIITLGGTFQTPEWLSSLTRSDPTGVNESQFGGQAISSPIQNPMASMLPERNVSTPFPPAQNIKQGQVGLNVNFSNAPKGTRVDVSDKDQYLQSLQMGYALEGGY